MLDEEIISLNRMKLFARSSDLSVVTAKDMNIVVNLVEKQQKEIEELKDNLEKFEVSYALCVNDRVSKDKIKAKIEVLEKLQKEFPKYLFEEIKQRYEKSNKYMLCVTYEDIGILIHIIEVLEEQLKVLNKE